MEEQFLSKSNFYVPVSDCSCSESLKEMASNSIDNSLKINCTHGNKIIDCFE